ncbi:MAG: hypothetical protein KKB50_15895 [Planctomycetes bacterium]|nr:hypothetical protein [Planctomycetota bacterium]
MSTRPIRQREQTHLPPRERLLPLLYRVISLAYYRRSERYARYREEVGSPPPLPAEPLTDLLAVYLSQRLPARWVGRLGLDGLLRCAKTLRGVLCAAGFFGLLGFWFVRGVFRTVRRLGALGRGAGARAAPECFLKRAPVGNLNISIGQSILLRGFEYADNRLVCYFERTQPIARSCQIFVHAYPADAAALPADRIPHGQFCKDHDPVVEIQAWPRKRVYRDETWLGDLPSGDYRLEIGLVDIATLERLPMVESERSAAELGWVRVSALDEAAPEPNLIGAAHGSR